MQIRNLGLLKYAEALQIMEAEHALLVADAKRPETLLVVSHPAVVTMGNRELHSDMNFTPAWLAERGIDYVKIDRGGSVTVHEPGQVVLYPLVRLDARVRTVRSFVHALEEAMIACCAEYGVAANRDPVNPGVWVGQNKIGALGIRVLNHVTKHGLAFNVTNSLKTFETIVPCGIRSRGVTSLALEVGKNLAHPELNIENSDFLKKAEDHLVKFLNHFLTQSSNQKI